MSALIPPAALRRRAVRSRFLRLAGLLGVTLALVGCGGSAALPADGAPVDQNGGAPMPAATAAPAEAGSKTGDEAYVPSGAGGDTVIGPLIVRTGQLTLEVAVLDDSLAAADKVVTAAGGYVAASQRQGEGDSAGATVTYRIPAERWEATLAALRAVGSKVLAEQTASEEVTSQVVDLGARLLNLRATESSLQAIMAKATKIPDILEVQAQLTSVRQEIEQLTAQKLSLEKQAALATLTVAFTPPPVVAVAQVREGWDPAGEVDQAAATLVGLTQGVVSAVIWVVIVLLPLALVLGFAIAIAWLVARRIRPRSTPPAPPATAPPATLDAPAA